MALPNWIPNKLKHFTRRKARQIAFEGDTVYCPCCKGKFNTFLPGGVAKKRPHALCPACSSLERHRLLWHYLTHKTALFDKKMKLLHVAPEKLFYQKFVQQPNIEYTPCAKFGEGYADEYPEGTKNIDITDIEIDDNTFDAILCSHVLEHIPEDLQAMRELFRVLKPGGWAILQVPLDKKRDKTFEDFSITDPKEREKAFGQYDHVRVYGNDYQDRLETAGFKVNKDNYISSFSEEDVFRFGFMKGEDIFFCTKN